MSLVSIFINISNQSVNFIISHLILGKIVNDIRLVDLLVESKNFFILYSILYIFFSCTSTLLLILLTNFILSSYTDPGYLSHETLDLKNIESLKLSEPIKNQFKKTCLKCNHQWKPPRAHHCKRCKKCVFKVFF